MSSVRPILKRIHSPDVAVFEEFCPMDPRCFSVLIQAMYGPEDSQGEESFDVEVCTPAWLEREVQEKGIVSGRHRLIVQRFDPNELRSYFEKIAAACIGDSWDDVALKLSQVGKWEFEDYQD